jgi:glutathione S-transferase
MKLYHCPQTRSARVRWMLEELGEPHEISIVNIYAGEGRSPEHKARHPHGYVPVLVDDDLTLIESSAICMYLADKYGKLAPPAGSAERGKYYQWMVYAPATVDPTLEAIMFNTVFLPEDKRDPKLVERMKKRWATIQDVLSAAIKERPWILGDEFSAADVVIASCAAWAKMAGVLGDPALEKYLESAMKRPAFMKAYAGEDAK